MCVCVCVCVCVSVCVRVCALYYIITVLVFTKSICDFLNCQMIFVLQRLHEIQGGAD